MALPAVTAAHVSAAFATLSKQAVTRVDSEPDFARRLTDRWRQLTAEAMSSDELSIRNQLSELGLNCLLVSAVMEILAAQEVN